MKKVLLFLLCLAGVISASSGNLRGAPMSLDLSSALNYDGVGTQNEITYCNGKSGNRRLADILGGHNLANAGLALTNTASLSSGAALPRFGVVGNYAGSFAYDSSSGSTYTASPNCVHLMASSSSGTAVSASVTITLNSAQQINYNDLNFLFVQNRSTGAGTYRTTVSVTYTDGTTATLKDTGAITVAANGLGGTFGSAMVNGQGGLTGATDSDASVANVYSSAYGVVTSGSAGNYTSVISPIAGSNLWQLATPLSLTSSKLLKSVTFQVQASQANQWNELTIFGLDADMTYYAAPPASDPTVDLNVTLTSRMGAHPRIMMTPATISSLKAFYNNTAQSQIWRNEFDAYVPACTVPINDQFLTDATEAQRQGLWRLPTAALDYVLTGNQSAFNNAVGFLQLYLALPDWETDIERNSGMAAANNMVGVALAYDWLYNDLDPTFREQVRQKLFAQARALYYGGYEEQNSNISAIYWQVDPLNNQRWHRQAGLVLAVIAAYSGDPSQNYMVNAAASETSFVNQWLPPSGSSHESLSYQTFGCNHLVMAQQASDDNFGTSLLGSAFFQTVGAFHIQMKTASFAGTLDFGDYGGTNDDGSYGNFLLLLAAHNGDAGLRAGVLKLFAVNPTALTFSWWSLLWDNPNLTGGSYTSYPLTGYFGDLGLTSLRDSWTAGGITAMFKCSPLGGIAEDQYRDANNETYVNVAHDDPDANSFILFSGDDELVSSDQYSQRKQSSQQNTILVNNLGQNASGRSPAAQVFEQPATSGSMLGMATAFPPVTLVNGTIVSEGEAAGSYPATTNPGTRPAISRYRRLFLWAANKYALVLDDLRSPSAVTFTALTQGPGVTAVSAAQGTFKLSGGTHTCGFQVIGSQSLAYSIIASTADNKSTSLNYQELQASASATSLQLASLFNAWAVSNLSVTLQIQTSTSEDIAVTGNGVADTYRWTYATGSTSPSSIIPLIAPSITSASPTAMATVGSPYTYTIAATGSPTPTFTVTPGALPPGLMLSSNGTITGTPATTGVYTGQITASNTIGTPAVQSFAITVQSAFTAWESKFFSPAQLSDPSISGPNANPSGDGTGNLLKYIFDISPAAAMSAADRAGLPQLSIITDQGKEYFTLTYRHQRSTNGCTISLQSSTNLNAGFTTVTPDYNATFSDNAGIDPNNGDPRVQVGVLLGSGKSLFLRLIVTQSP